MIQNAPSLDLVEFIETKILPQYAAFDAAHNMEHVTRVIRHSLELVKITGADINMVYTIAAYHDLGMSGPRAVHHLTGGKILATDARLRKAIAALDYRPTVFVISQRAASVMGADLILVLDDGRVAGKGTHSQLMESCPIYREIYESQFGRGAAV